jgi:two-component system, OmpR family, sensor histidine kinase TctE
MSRRVPSLFARLIGFIALVLVIGAGVLGGASWLYARVAAQEAYDRLLVGAALQIAESVATEPGRVTVDPPNSAFETLAMAVDDRIFYRVTDPHGEVLTGQADLPSAAASRQPERVPALSDGNYRGFAVRIVTIGRSVTGPGIAGRVDVTVAQTLIARLALTRELTEKALLLVMGMSAFAIIGVVLAVRRALRPLDLIQATLQARDPKDLAPIDVETPREISTLVDSLNHFLGRLALRISGIERFVADAAHQIRTPLTALTAQIDLLATETRADRQRDQVRRIRHRTDQLGRLTSQLLSHATVIHRREVVRLAPTDLLPLAREALAEAVPLSLDRDLSIAFDSAEPSILVAGDSISIREAIANVIHNAIRHGAPASLSVTVSVDGGEAVVAVADDGAGIPDAARAEVVKPFVRGPGQGAGSGLGLAIVADVLAAHGGRLVFRQGAGPFTVELRMPILTPSDAPRSEDAG